MKIQLNIPNGYSAAVLHTHTNRTDGMVSPRELVEAAAEAGIRVLAITDHDCFLGIKEAQRVGLEYGVDVVVGEEIQTSLPRGLHIVGLFLKKPVAYSKSVEWTVQKIREQGGIAVAVHPMVRFFNYIPSLTGAIQMWDFRSFIKIISFDAIEIRHKYLRERDINLLDNFYEQNERFLGAKIGASDSHFGEADMFHYYTLFPGKSAKDLYEALKDRTTKVARGPQTKVGIVETLLQTKKALVDLGLKRYGKMAARWVRLEIGDVEEVME